MLESKDQASRQLRQARTWKDVVTEAAAPHELLAGGPSVFHYFIMTVALIRYDAARRALAAAHRVDEVKAISSEHRAIRRKARTLHVHSKHTSSVQTVQHKVKTIRKGLRGTSSSIALKEQALAEIKAAWQRIEKYNLEFGKVCYEWRNKFKAQGFRKEGDGVSPILDELGIPKSSAYYWMNRYEISIGLKPAKAERQKPEALLPWTPDNEKRANRSEPIGCMEGYKILAKKMLEAGYCALLAKKAADQSHLWAAKDWAKLRLEFGDAFED